jgi:hypothetical protein
MFPWGKIKDLGILPDLLLSTYPFIYAASATGHAP